MMTLNTAKDMLNLLTPTGFRDIDTIIRKVEKDCKDTEESLRINGGVLDKMKFKKV